MPTQKQNGVIVGVSEYPGLLHDLPGVANDVKEMHDLLVSPRGVLVDSSIELLTNRDATAQRILDAVKSVCDGATGTDVIYLYFSGHGGERNGESYFIAHDHQQSGWVPLSEIRDVFQSADCRGAFLFLDICHAGGIVGRSRDAENAAAKSEEVYQRTIKVSGGSGHVVMAACQGDESAYEDAGHGVFTSNLVAGLKGAAANQFGRVTPNSLHDYVCEHIIGQTPVYWSTMTGSLYLMYYPEKADTKASPGSSGDGTIATSGDLILLNDILVKCDSVSVQAGGTWTVEAGHQSVETETSLRQITGIGMERRHVHQSKLTVTHENTFAEVILEDAKRTSVGGTSSWLLTLKPDRNAARRRSPRNVRINVQERSRTWTPDQIAELRARRILLAEDFEAGSMSERLVESAAKSGCEPAPLEMAAGDVDGETLQLLRLHMVRELLKSETVDHIHHLQLTKDRGALRVEFRGQQDSQYANQPPHLVEVEGTWQPEEQG